MRLFVRCLTAVGPLSHPPGVLLTPVANWFNRSKVGMKEGTEEQGSTQSPAAYRRPTAALYHKHTLNAHHGYNRLAAQEIRMWLILPRRPGGL